MGYTNIHQVYVADGFNDDCERLINRCTRAGKVTYELFCELWKEMNFDTLFRGRSSGAEIAELSEELVYTAKQHMLSSTGKFEASVAGLFIVYAVLHIQPYRGFAALRLVPEDLPAVTRLEGRARRARRLDVLYVLGSILIQNTEYHAAERERGMESPYRKYLEGYLNIDSTNVRPHGIFSHHNEELDLLQDISRLTADYSEFKKSFSSTINPKNLNYLNPSLSKELDTSLKNIIGGFIEDLNDNETNEPANNSSDNNQRTKMQEIKERAMKLGVGKIKHLTGINERETNSRSQPKTQSDIKSKGGKIKTSSPTKPVSPKKRAALSKSSSSPSKSSPSPSKSSPNPSKSSPSPSKSSPSPSKSLPSPSKSSPSTSKSNSNTTPAIKRTIGSRKRKQILKPRRKHRKIRRKAISESDTESDDSDEFILDNFDKPEVEVPPKQNKPIQDTNENQSIEMNIQIDRLPCFIRTEQDGKTFEIEIIDELNPKKVIAKANEDNETMVVRSKNDDSHENDSNEKFKLPPDLRLKKVDKRDMKKSVMLSKFKRLGILPVANFNDKQ